MGSQISGKLIEGAEPLSVRSGTYGVLVLHGFTGNPQSMRPIADGCVEAGYSVEMPLLAGHGTRVEDMIPTRFPDYISDARQAYTSLNDFCEKVIVVGLSMGGTLTLSLALENPDIRGIVLVNPLCEPPAPSFVEMMAATLESGMDTFTGIGSDIAKEGCKELAYPETPLAPLLSLFDAVSELAPRLGGIECPVLLYSSRQDHVVPGSNGDLLESALGNRVERKWLERSFHVATLDYDKDVIVGGTVDFARRVFG